MKKLAIRITLLILSVACSVGTFHAGSYQKERQFQRTLIDKGYAEFDRKTGKWQLVSLETLTIINSIPLGKAVAAK